MTELFEAGCSDPIIFACMLHRFEGLLSVAAFSKSSAIQEHIVKLSIRKLVAARDEKRGAFHAICTEQKRLAIEGIRIINNDLQVN
jgi:hypothetical protein